MIAAEQTEGRRLLLDYWLHAAEQTAALADDWLHCRVQTGLVFPERMAADSDSRALATFDAETAAAHHTCVENEQFSYHSAGSQQHRVTLGSMHFVREEEVPYTQVEQQHGHSNVAAIPLAAGVADVWPEVDSAVLA